MVDWLEKAARCVELVEKYCDENTRKAFRARARQMASELYYVGAPYVLAILAARSSERHVFTPRGLEEAVRDICASELPREDRGYALYGLCFVDAVREVGVKAGGLTDMLRELKRLSGLAEARLSEFVDWLKKLAEAKFEAEK